MFIFDLSSVCANIFVVCLSACVSSLSWVCVCVLLSSVWRRCACKRILEELHTRPRCKPKIYWKAFGWESILPRFVRCNKLITKLIWSKHSKKLFASLSSAPSTVSSLMCLWKQSKLPWCAWTMWSWLFSHIGTSEGDSMFVWSPPSLSLCGWKVAPYLSK